MSPTTTVPHRSIDEYLHNAYELSQKWSLPNGTESYNSISINSISIATVGVIGGGTMGRSIAVASARAGYRVILVEQNEQLIDACKHQIDVIIERECTRRRMSTDERAQIYARLQYDTKLESLADVDLIASATNRPESVIGIHFFNPAHLQKTVEVVYGRRTNGRAIATAFEMSRRMQKISTLVRNCPGFLFNRLLIVYLGQSMQLMSAYGFYPHHIDQIFTAFGMSLGPITLADLNGLDVMKRIGDEHGWQSNPLLVRLVAKGRYGRKSGKGFYDYLQPSGKKVPDMFVEQLIMQKIEQAPSMVFHSAQDQLRFVLYPMINEGFRCIDEHIVESAPLIDLMFIYGLDWPMHTGGPMHWAQYTVGLSNILLYLNNQYNLTKNDVWKPAESLKRLAAGRSSHI